MVGFLQGWGFDKYHRQRNWRKFDTICEGVIIPGMMESTWRRGKQKERKAMESVDWLWKYHQRIISFGT